MKTTPIWESLPAEQSRVDIYLIEGTHYWRRDSAKINWMSSQLVNTRPDFNLADLILGLAFLFWCKYSFIGPFFGQNIKTKSNFSLRFFKKKLLFLKKKLLFFKKKVTLFYKKKLLYFTKKSTFFCQKKVLFVICITGPACGSPRLPGVKDKLECNVP